MSDSSTRPREAVVLGAGVIGLAAAIRLRDAGLPVTIVAADLPTDAVPPRGAGEWPPRPVSPRAAAIWYPYRAEPRALVDRWAVETLAELRRLSSDPAAGVSEVELTEWFDGPVPREVWHADVGTEPADVPLPDGATAAVRMRVPFVDTPVHLRWLLGRAREAGVRIERRVAQDLAELYAPGRVVVNAAGLASHRLCADAAVYPCRGRVLRVERVPGVGHLLREGPGEAPTYVFPRAGDCILGGTADDDAWDEAPDAEVEDAILARCVALEPRLAGVRVLDRGVGLRPARHGSIRLEREEVGGGCAVIHDYGHGGAGFTLAWGCADEVARLAGA